MHIALEGLPASGKSEILELLARGYPRGLVTLPEMVKEVAIRERISVLRERDKLTAALREEIPRRNALIDAAVATGSLCLEESHLGVHLAYARALEDHAFVKAYREFEAAARWPERFVRLEIPPKLSVLRQEARGTPEFNVSASVLTAMTDQLHRWHRARGSRVAVIDADRPPASLLADVERDLALVYASPLDETILPILFLLGRPASGKSEFIDLMIHTPAGRRASRFHLGALEVLDDFPILWGLFEDDDLWERLGRPRRFSRPVSGNYAVTDDGVWSFLTERLNREILRRLEDPSRPTHGTLLVEFSRGAQYGYADALERVDPAILARAAILYIEVSRSESRRRNVARYDRTARDQILTHSVPHEEMSRTYASDDWKRLAPDPSGTLVARGVSVPYVSMRNEPESTDPGVLEPRYAAALDRLADLRLMPN